MSYEKQTFVDQVLNSDGTVLVKGTVLSASHLNHIEDGIVTLETELQKQQSSSSAAATGVKAALEKMRDLLYKAVYTEDVSSVLGELDTLLENIDTGGSGTTTTKTLVGITASYSGGPVPVGTLVHDLSGVAVTARYSDGSTATVTDWTFLADYGDVITEGTNTVWVRYEDYEASFAVIGLVVDDGGDDTEVTLTKITATYTGGSVPVGTAVTDLKGIAVVATYSDGSTETVTDYTLSGSIAEGSNTITVLYGSKYTSFTVTGVSDDEPETSGDAQLVITDSGVSATDDGDGNVTVTGMTATDDGNGNITVS